MKCLLLAPLQYPFVHSMISGIKAAGLELRTEDYQDFFSPMANRLFNQFSSLPRKMRKWWEDPYVKKTNERYQEIYREFNPDLVIIYNNQLLLPKTLEQFRKKSKIAFLLGDNPLYTPTSIYNLHLLFAADYVVSPDSMWVEQLTKLGIHNVVFECFSFNSDHYYPMEVPDELRKQYQSDLVYIGSASKTNWGYKRALFLNLFKDFDLRAYISGSGMERWYPFFPGLEKKVIPHDRFDAKFNNLVYNCSKIAPVEQVPSLFHGIHVRVFDALGAGVLPLCEQNEDMELVFDGIDIPLIREYSEGPELAAWWLAHDDKREECVAQMRARAMDYYAPEKVIERMVDEVFSSHHNLVH